jgi:tetrapyrrole methylase family protein/MazG family protein
VTAAPAAARPRIQVAGLGPAGASLVTAATRDLLGTVRPAFLRTSRHPAVTELDLADLPTFDEVYDEEATLDDVYAVIVDRLVASAREAGDVLYVVPGSPAVAERTVELLHARAAAGDVELVVHPALSFVDLTWVRLGIDPVAEGVRIVDGQRFAADAADERGPLLVAQCDTRAVLSDIKLALDDDPGAPVRILHHLGLDDEQIVEASWEDLDRTLDEPDHLTSIYVPRLAAPIGREIADLTALMHTLRAECPWDREQTHRTLIRHLVEETYEVVEALEQVDADAGTGYDELEEELGDLLFQVVFHCELAAEAGQFTLADVARTVHDKLYGRHPHVFGDVEVDGPEGVEANWDRIKREEKGRSSAMDGIPGGLPALLLALKAHERADRAGMPFPSVESAFGKVAEELAELQADPGARELGDLLFATTGLAHELDVDPEDALRASAERFRRRFRRVEELAAADGLDTSTGVRAADQDALDRWWDRAKADLSDA